MDEQIREQIAQSNNLNSNQILKDEQNLNLESELNFKQEKNDSPLIDSIDNVEEIDENQLNIDKQKVINHPLFKLLGELK